MFIVFEGLDGSGKSTLMKAFKKSLLSKQIRFEQVFDPGGTRIGDQIRKILLSKEEKLLGETELLLYQASRAELVAKKIKPALKEGKWVISDRFYQSTLAFQGYGRGLSLSNIDWLNSFATKSLVPNVVIWVDTPVDICQHRLQKRKSEGKVLDRLEEEKLSFHNKVYEGYKSILKADQKSYWIVLNGGQSFKELIRELDKKFLDFQRQND